eukprot:CAMPEP_0170603382 /NCGR_PEP_ID=MMETSP0224-20130122/18884_1 /TAXON_ID=285029 /ORGANISM="Togula jolla, Strain CCCM 725" /LENGTH=141 /DNA_ID=CAMNT_0010928263 /DNA_START=341 /DNA_END=766 /DNA_ORIENTATION=+
MAEPTSKTKVLPALSPIRSSTSQMPAPAPAPASASQTSGSRFKGCALFVHKRGVRLLANLLQQLCDGDDLHLVIPRRLCLLALLLRLPVAEDKEVCPGAHCCGHASPEESDELLQSIPTHLAGHASDGDFLALEAAGATLD